MAHILLSDQVQGIRARPLFIDRLKKNLERRSEEDARLLLSQDAILENRLYKRSFNNGSAHLLISEDRIDGQSVFCFLRILNEGQEYKHLVQDPRQWLREHSLDSAKLQEAALLLASQAPASIENRPQAPEGLLSWLNPLSLELDVTIYEGEAWALGMTQNFRLYWQTYKELIREIIDQEENTIEIINETIFLAKKNKCYILYQPFDRHSEQAKVYFLYAHFFGEKPSPEDIKKVLQIYPKFQDFSDMLPFAMRAYPDWVTAVSIEGEEGDLWCELEGIHRKQAPGQLDPANLALSGEEEALLKTAKLPLFINGQAGSGKSTMLMYLFASYCASKFSKGDTYLGVPLFLTYNENLLNEARRTIASILSRNPEYRNAIGQGRGSIDSLQNWLWPFQEFIRQRILSYEICETRFPEEKYLSYEKFKQYYGMPNDAAQKTRRYLCSLPERKRFSPDLCWHVIRTFIKGYRFGSELRPEDYAKIPAGDKSVEDENYKQIYDTIYLRWYKELGRSHGFWDDLDLVHEALGHLKRKDYMAERYPVIFCDEAQDYTRLELEFLLALSSFTRYHLQGLDSLPFAFAGDALQTLNPTGFSWKRLRSDFHAKFVEMCQSELSLFDSNLTKNYRSSAEIVRLANSIQFFRKFLLQEKDRSSLRPQDCWRDKESARPCKFIFNKNFEEKDLSLASDTTILVPTEAGGEEDFIHKDQHLIELMYEKSYNVFSPASAKGLEFSRVILYKFGESLGPLFSESLQNCKTGMALDESKEIQLSYFFNKLYVALTRARDFLYIIDTEEGEQNLWRYLERDSLQERYHLLLSEPEDWPEETMGSVLLAGKEQAIELVDKDPLAKAEELSQKGRRYQNPDYLRRASYHYRDAGEIQQGKLCLAEAYTLEGQWENAAELWIGFGQYERASECLWKGGLWENLWDLHSKFPGLDSFRRNVARFMKEKRPDLRLALETVLHPEVLQNLPVRDTVFSKVLQRLLRVTKVAHSENRRDWTAIAELLERILAKGFASRALILEIATCYFKGQSWSKAAEFWEEIHVQGADYYRAKYLAASLPEEQIRWLVKLPYDSDLQGKPARELLEAAWKNTKTNNPELYDRTAYFYYKGKQWQQAIDYWEDWRAKCLQDDKSQATRCTCPREYHLACYNIATNTVERIAAMLSIQEEERTKADRECIKENWEIIKKNENALEDLRHRPIKFRLLGVLKDSLNPDTEYKKLFSYSRSNVNHDIYLLVRDLSGSKEWKEYATLYKWGFPYVDIRKLVAVMASSEQRSWNDAGDRKINEVLFGTLSKEMHRFSYKKKFAPTEKKFLVELTLAFERLVFHREEKRKEKYFRKIWKNYEQISEFPDAPDSVRRWAKKRWILVVSKAMRELDTAVKEAKAKLSDMNEKNKLSDYQNAKTRLEKLERRQKNLNFLFKRKVDYVAASIEKNQVEIFLDDFPESAPGRDAWIPC